MIQGMNNPMKIIYMGTSDFAVPALEALINAGYSIEMVVTQPDKRGNRGKLQASPVKELAIKHGLRIEQPVRIKKDEEFISELEKIKPDFIVVAAFGQILSKRVLEVPKYDCLNIHGSLLPKLRGAAPMQFAIAEGLELTGVTIMRMDEGLDTGDMISKSEIDLPGKDIFQVTEELAAAGAKLLIETIPKIVSGEANYTSQNEAEATHTVLIKKSDGETDFSGTANEEKQKLLAFLKWPNLYSFYNGKLIKFYDADVIPDSSDKDNIEFGTVTDVSKESFTIKCGKGSLVIKELQMEGKKRMRAEDFLRGIRLKQGDRFTKRNFHS